MLIKMLKKDFFKKKIISITLFIFVMLSALLVASGSNMIIELMHSLNHLFIKSNVPHFVQMHTGEIDKDAIDSWSSQNNRVKKNQIVQMINIEGSKISFNHSHHTEKYSLMDHYFVKQNHLFDFLLNLNNDVIKVSSGEIAVPIYYMQTNNLDIGDKVTVSIEGLNSEFKIVDFVRDAQMNPSIIHSKRFVINEVDFDRLLQSNVGEREYLIEFLLNDVSELSQFRNEYQSSNMPQKGPDIDVHLFKALNAITDGIVAIVIILVSILLITIAILCIRFTILAAIEEDFKEIGVMKAIGISQRDIRNMYLVKYVVMVALASVFGYVISLFVNHLFTANIMLYIGTAPKKLLLEIVPLISISIIFLIVIFSSMLTLRRFKKISVVDALRLGSLGEIEKYKSSFALNRSRFLNIHIFIGLKDLFNRARMYRLLLFVFFVSAFIIIVPVNFLNTIQSPDFITYMGVERSDIRIDSQESDPHKFMQIIDYIKNDQDVERFSPLVTNQFKVVNDDGILENINVETGDFSIFSLEYLKGTAPLREHEIALSYLNGKELQKSIGDYLTLVIDGQQRRMIVSGIYQDVTNGGRTAKAMLPSNHEKALSYTVSIDVKPHINKSKKIDEYVKEFYPAKVTDTNGYLAQTFAGTIEQLRFVTLIAIIIALFVSMLITSLFLKMLITKDNPQIQIMKSIGFSSRGIQIQYITRALLVLGFGIILGTITANSIGQSMVSILISFMGASKIKFVIDPLQAYILSPLMLMAVVTLTTLISTNSIVASSTVEMDG